MLFLGGCATINDPLQVVTYEGVYLKDLCDKYNASLTFDSISQVVLINGRGIDIRGMVGSDIVFVGSRKVQLSEPIRTVNSAIIAPEGLRDLMSSTEPVGKTTVALAPVSKKYHSYDVRSIRSVVIDAGHGGKDPGATGRTGLREKKVVLDIARRLKRILERKGIKVVMSRSKDQFISLGKRTEIASSSRSDIFVSIHANSHPQRSVHGVEVYSLKKLGYLEKSEDQRKANYKKMFRSLKMKRDDRDLQDIVADLYDSNKQAESEKLGRIISSKAAGLLRTKNLGLKKSRFYVLRNTLIPAVLVEVGFLSNPKEEKLLKTKGYRQKVAVGIAAGILEYENM